MLSAVAQPVLPPVARVDIQLNCVGLVLHKLIADLIDEEIEAKDE